MKKAIWKPSKEELEELAVYRDETYFRFGLWEFFKEGNAQIVFVPECKSGEFAVYDTWEITELESENGFEIFPRSKQELQAFISMFEENE